ncbi:Transcription termination factor MTERF9, chloroplastic [Coccomyxa sp. Obi]|nr:Transcription termination factor MTERF9, chloroplastic [Coccomyxa sp. Obi]
MQRRGLLCRSHALWTTWQPSCWLQFAQALQSAWPQVEQRLGRKGPQEGDSWSWQRLLCSASGVTVADAPVKAPLKEELLEQQKKPPGVGSRANDSTKRKSRLQSKLQELGEGDALEEGFLLDEAMFQNLARRCNLKPQWHEKVTLLCRLGMTEADLRKLSSGDAVFFDGAPKTVRAKLKFLRSEVKLTDAKLRKLLLKFPRIAEKSIRLLAAHADFWRSTGISNRQVAKLVLQQPSLLTSISVEATLRPRLAYLCKISDLPAERIGRVIVRASSVMTSKTDTLRSRVTSLRETGLTKEQIAGIVEKHPQVLCYSQSSVSKRLDFLDTMGLSQADAAHVVATCPSLLGLDVDTNLWPTYNFLTQDLEVSAANILSCPSYLALSLKGRIIPRHRFWELHMQRRLPVSYLTYSDEKFCAKAVKQPLESYEHFKTALELPDLKDYEGGPYLIEGVLSKTLEVPS